ncbi:MAG: sporulation protein YqfD [Clostridiales bacterium]|nr:sporulation protein YqfD [Clostridiales bacterium]
MGRGYDYFEGYVVVELKAINPEKFLNLATKNGIKVWDVIRLDYTTIEFKTNVEDFKKLKYTSKKVRAKIKIKSKKGSVFFMYKLLRRKLFIVGIILFLGIIYFLSNLVWIINIYGNKKITNEKIQKTLYNKGVKIGSKKSNLNLRQLEDAIKKELSEVSIINMSFDGVKLNVEIVERTMPPSITTYEQPSDIIAQKDGIITKIFCYKGTPLIKEGDYVKNGQVLISGDVIILNRENGQPETVKIARALGSVYAKVWYENTQEIILNETKRQQTGKIVNNTYYVINGKKIYTNKHDVNFKIYDKIENKERVKLQNYELPIEKVEEYYYEVVEIKQNYTVNEAVEIAKRNAENELLKQIPNNTKILDKKIEKIIEKNKVKIRLLYITEEQISMEKMR